MNLDWNSRWENNQIGWHSNNFNTRMLKYLPNLGLQTDEIIFVPLCGKSLDMIYFLNQGFKVIGVELSPIEIIDFFKENNIIYEVIKDGNFEVYKSENITIYQGNIFDLTAKHLANITAIYDRASLIALNTELRSEYAKLFNGIIKDNVIYLLLTLDYNQEQINGPPFAVSKNEVENIFKNWQIKQIDSFNDIENETKFKSNGLTILNKETYILRKKN